MSKTKRGGQNLSERYKRLERSLRGKDKGTESKVRLTGKGSVVTSSMEKTKEDIVMFRGIEIRREPKAPDSEGE